MKAKHIYTTLIILALAALGLYFYQKYNVAPPIDISKIEVVDRDTNRFDIQSLKGKKVIVSFYASWCPNCLVELKEINSIKESRLSDVTVLCITDESIEKMVSFQEKNQYPFTFVTLVSDFRAFGIHSIPTTYLLNTKGEVVYDNVGYIDWADESTCEHLKSLMQ
jgi:peroxiredoxin